MFHEVFRGAIPVSPGANVTVFTISGGHIENLLDGLSEYGIRTIDVRHEQAAAMMAHAWSVYKIAFRQATMGRPGPVFLSLTGASIVRRPCPAFFHGVKIFSTSLLCRAVLPGPLPRSGRLIFILLF